MTLQDSTEVPEIDEEATQRLHQSYEAGLVDARARVAEARKAFEDAESILAYWERAERLYIELDCRHMQVTRGNSS